jgi:hypothetical protein
MFPTLLAAPLFITTLVNDLPRPSPLDMNPPLTREDIKAARDKFDREMKLDTKRPWDGTNWRTPSVEEQDKPKPKAKSE